MRKALTYSTEEKELVSRQKRRVRNWSKRLLGAIQLLWTPYRGLLWRDGLIFKRRRFARPIFTTVFEDSEWKVLEVEGFRFFWPHEYDDRELPGLYREIFAPTACNPHAYEMEIVRIQPGDWVVDAGACEGFFTHYALRRGAQVLMIEPVPKLAQALSHTFEQEMRAGRVRLLQGGIGKSRGEMKLEIPQDTVYDAHISQEGTEPVTMYTLDGIIENGIVPSIDFVKMDIEGQEIAAFKGATELLRLHSPKLSIAVYHEFLNAQIVRSLILEAQPVYQVSWRGVFLPEGFASPRPYMLHARV